MNNKKAIINNIHPTVNGYSFEVPDTCERLQVRMDDLFNWMSINREDLASSASHFNHSIDNLKDSDLQAIINNMYLDAPEKIQVAQFSQTPAPAPSLDQYEHHRHDESPALLEELEMCNEGINQLQSITAQVHLLTKKQEQQIEDNQTIIKLVQEFLDTHTIMHNGLPTLDNLLDQFIIKRRRTKDGALGKKTVKCSKNWLNCNISTTDILCLMREEKINVKAKSGKGESMYQLNPIKIQPWTK